MEEIKVSICCITYNHEKYIGNALESFLMQKTNFKFEIIVHDDASTDQTPQIIKEYAEKYPDIIVPILQTKNQYSQGIKIAATYIWPRVRGKYITICEGDDFWIDEHKLQKQFEKMEIDKELAFCCHCNKEYDIRNNQYSINRQEKLTGKFNLEQFLKAYYSQAPKTLFQTSSIFMRRDYILKLLKTRPQFYFKCSIGDIPMELFLLTLGDGYYMQESMSVYRRFSEESWSNAVYSDKKRLIKHYNDMINMYEGFNLFTESKYQKIIYKFVDIYKFKLDFQQEKYRKIIRLRYFRELKKLPLKSIVYVLVVGTIKGNK